jgi:hypothetical protein
MRTRILLLVVLAILLGPPSARAQRPPAPALGLKHSPRPTSAAITSADLATRVYIFADDSMLGRLPGSLGEQRAVAYLEREARRLGLRPAAGSDGYRQAVPLVYRWVSERSSLSGGGASFELWKDFAPAPTPRVPWASMSPRRFDATPVVFGGVYSDTSTWIAGDSAAGKAVLLVTKPGDGIANTARFDRSLAVIIDDLPSDPPGPVAAVRRRQALLRRGPGGSMSIPIRIRVTRDAAVRLLGGVRLDGLRPGTRGTELTGTIAFVDTLVSAWNVVGVLPATARTGQPGYVALMAHHDAYGFNDSPLDHDSLHAYSLERERRSPSVGRRGVRGAAVSTDIRVNTDSLRSLRPVRPDSIFNGAMDDASGSMALLEIAEALSRRGAARRSRSLLFVWHAAEEAGKLGSAWFTDTAPALRDSIVAALNIDGFGWWERSDYESGGPRTLVLGGARGSPELGAIARRVNEQARGPLILDFELDVAGRPSPGWCASDHIMYARYGIPALFVSSPLAHDQHRPTDEPQYLDYYGMARATAFVRDLAITLANAPRPKRSAVANSDLRALCS